MAKTDVLIDAGPLIAFFDRRDQHHAWTKTQMAHLTTPLYTCEAVLSGRFTCLSMCLEEPSSSFVSSNAVP